MFDRPLSDAGIEQLRGELTEAHARYNDALTRLDRAVAGEADVPAPPPVLDETKLTPLNESWRILPADRPDGGGGWRGRLTAFVWRLVAPILDRQQHFNATLVDHVNRNIAGERAAREALRRALPVLGEHLAGLARFESLLLQFLQQITGYIDTKDRDVTLRILQHPIRTLEQGIALVQQQQVALRREAARLAAAAVGRSPETDGAAHPSRAGSTYAAGDAYKYLCFEEEFRGNEASIRGRFEDYGVDFEGATDVLDVGCGRGEFLALLRDLGIPARGVDPNPDMVERCRMRDLLVDEGDAVGYLEGLDDGSLGGLFAGQVVEHLEAAYLMRFLELAYEKLRPGSTIVVETINPDCWSAFFGPYLRDITHAHALPPETLRFLLQASGFQRMQVRARSPVADDLKLHRLNPSAAEPALVAAFNANSDRLNGLLFTHLDYAIIGEKL